MKTILGLFLVGVLVALGVRPRPTIEPKPLYRRLGAYTNN